MDTKTKTELENDVKRIAVEYLRYATNYGHDDQRAASFYDQIYYLGELSRKINLAQKEKDEAKPAED